MNNAINVLLVIGIAISVLFTAHVAYELMGDFNIGADGS